MISQGKGSRAQKPSSRGAVQLKITMTTVDSRKINFSIKAKTMIPNITRSVDWVFLHCNVSSVLYSFSSRDLQVSYPFQKEPYRLEWLPVNKTEINAIRVCVSDGGNNILDLNGVDVAVDIMIEEE